MTEPTYEMFAHRGKVGGLATFVRSLREGEPQILPEEFRHKPLSSFSSQIKRTADAAGFKVAARTIDGELWACRLKPEDAQNA